jgi:hypothetical protein
VLMRTNFLPRQRQKQPVLAPFFCAFLTAIAPPISPKLCGPPTGLANGVVGPTRRTEKN